MKKTLSLLLALTLVVSLFASVGTASAAGTAGEQLKAMGVIKGDTSGSLNETSTWDKQDLAVLISRLAGKEEAAAATAKSHTFADVADDYYDGYISWALANKYITGVSATEFGFNQPVSYKVLNAVILRVLGYDTTGANYDTTEDLAVSVGISEATDFDAVAIRGIAYGTILKALELNVKGTEKSLGLTLGIKAYVDAAAAKAAEEAAAAKPQVVSVTAINAKTLEIKFNVAVNSAAAIVPGNYVFNNVVNTVVPSLSADGKTATFVIGTEAINLVTVKAITTAADSLVSTAVYTKTFSYTDSVKPEITSVTATTKDAAATSATITVSEPVASASVVKIDGVAVAAALFANTNSATISGLSLDVTKSHTIEIYNLTDLASTANVTTIATKTFNAVQDTVAPTVSLSAKSDKTILLTFSKSMNATTVTTALAANSSVKDESLAAVNHGVATVVADTDNKQFTIAVTPALYGTLTSRTLTVVIAGTITDSLGNAITATTKSVVLSKDTVAPVATGYTVTKDADGKVTSIVVNFSEGLAANANPAEPTVISADGVLVANLLPGFAASAITAGDTKITYTGTATALSGAYSLSFPASLASDQAETANTSAAFAYTIDFGAAAAATTTFNVTSAALTTTGSNIILVTFPEAVVGGSVAGSATDAARYTLNGKALPAGTTITLNQAKTQATITLPANSIATSDAVAIFTIDGVKAVSGNTQNSFTNTLAIVDNTAPVLTAAQVLGNSIYLTFSEALDTTTAADANIAAVLANYAITSDGTAVVAGSGVATTEVVANSDAKKLVITFTTLTGTNLDLTKTITVKTLAAGDLNDAQGVSAADGTAVTATR